MVMYHCTRREFLTEILKFGLEPIRPISRKVKDCVYKPQGKIIRAVFLSTNKFRWMHWATILPDDRSAAGAIFTIDVSGLEVVPDPNGEKGVDFCCLEPIRPERFKEVFFSSDKKPNSFLVIKLPVEFVEG